MTAEEIEEQSLQLAPVVRQETILAPLLREGLRVLQMDWQTLAGEVRHEAETNPVVELVEPDADAAYDADAAECVLPDEDADGTEAVPSDAGTTERVMPDEDEPDFYMDIDERAMVRRQQFFDGQVATVSMQEHLLSQTQTADFTDGERELAELIVGDINAAGRYVGSLEELASVTGATKEQLEGVLRRVQTFDPPGIGGRNLRECLEIQIGQLTVPAKMRALLLTLANGHLRAVAEGRCDQLAAELHVSASELSDALKVLRTLEPRPGRPFVPNGRENPYIRPELEIAPVEGGFELSSCERDLPTLRISPYYRDMRDDSKTDGETRQYLDERINHAEKLQEAIRRRGDTILRVAEVVFNAQVDFFAEGFKALKPLTIEDVADETGLHGTTVGRAIRGKYVRTPRGVYELRRFFCVGQIARKGGSEAVSAMTVKCRLREIVEAETDEILADEKICAQLKEEGFQISRRTVAKYRDELGIPPWFERIKRRRDYEHA